MNQFFFSVNIWESAGEWAFKATYLLLNNFLQKKQVKNVTRSFFCSSIYYCFRFFYVIIPIFLWKCNNILIQADLYFLPQGKTISSCKSAEL